MMTTFKLFGAALILSAAAAAPVAAQQAIQEPGAYAFYHPNADLGIGSTRPADAMASQNFRSGGDVAAMQLAVKPHKTLAIRTPAKRY
jgi:hypothetical protein